MSDLPYQAIFNALTGSAAVVDRTGKILAVNDGWRAFARENGAPDTAAYLGTHYLATCCDSATDPLREPFLRDFEALLAGRRDHFSYEYPCPSPEKERWFIMNARRVPESDPPCFLIQHVDITDRYLREQHHARQAERDLVTGMLNRNGILSRLRHALDEARLRREPLALFFLDLDGFKRINDRRGHETGDRVLEAIGKRLGAILRRSDKVGRYGGDEFLLYTCGTDDGAVAPILNRLEGAIGTPVETPGGRHTLSASVGIAFFPEDGTDVETLIQQADQAMYAAKAVKGERALTCRQACRVARSRGAGAGP